MAQQAPSTAALPPSKQCKHDKADAYDSVFVRKKSSKLDICPSVQSVFRLSNSRKEFIEDLWPSVKRLTIPLERMTKLNYKNETDSQKCIWKKGIFKKLKKEKNYLGPYICVLLSIFRSYTLIYT